MKDSNGNPVRNDVRDIFIKMFMILEEVFNKYGKEVSMKLEDMKKAAGITSQLNMDQILDAIMKNFTPREVLIMYHLTFIGRVLSDVLHAHLRLSADALSKAWTNEQLFSFILHQDTFVKQISEIFAKYPDKSFHKDLEKKPLLYTPIIGEA